MMITLLSPRTRYNDQRTTSYIYTLRISSNLYNMTWIYMCVFFLIGTSSFIQRVELYHRIYV
jgi:hypothetical protein